MSDRVRQILYDITYILDFKKYKKQMNITKKKQTHRYSEQTRAYQWREKEGHYRGARIGGTNFWV